MFQTSFVLVFAIGCKGPEDVPTPDWQWWELASPGNPQEVARFDDPSLIRSGLMSLDDGRVAYGGLQQTIEVIGEGLSVWGPYTSVDAINMSTPRLVDDVLIASMDSNTVALSLTGELLWTMPSTTEVVVIGNHVASCRSATGPCLLVIRDVSTGDVVWEDSEPAVAVHPSLHGVVLVRADRASVHEVDGAWLFDLPLQGDTELQNQGAMDALVMDFGVVMSWSSVEPDPHLIKAFDRAGDPIWWYETSAQPVPYEMKMMPYLGGLLFQGDGFVRRLDGAGQQVWGADAYGISLVDDVNDAGDLLVRRQDLGGIRYAVDQHFVPKMSVEMPGDVQVSAVLDGDRVLTSSARLGVSAETTWQAMTIWAP